MTTYAAGLRLSKVSTLQLTDIKSAPDRMCIKVRQGKGGKDRYTLLSTRLLRN
jgi:integrase/recombinase XerD